MKLNPEWIKKRMGEFSDYRLHQKPIDVTCQYNPAIQWLIMLLSKEGISFKLINLGAGVKRVTTLTDVCPKCNGTGKC